MEYTQERDRDFMNAYRRELRRALSRGEQVESGEVVRRAIEGGAPGFYIGFDYARRGVASRLRRRLRSRHRDMMAPRHMLWDELTERVERELTGGHGRLRLPEALARVLAAGDAPRFYISDRTARRILGKIKDKR